MNYKQLILEKLNDEDKLTRRFHSKVNRNKKLLRTIADGEKITSKIDWNDKENIAYQIWDLVFAPMIDHGEIEDIESKFHQYQI